MTKTWTSMGAAAIIFLGIVSFVCVKELLATARESPTPSAASSLSRTDLIKEALVSTAAFDCSAATTTGSPLKNSATANFFQVGSRTTIIPPSDNTPLYLGTWSTRGDAIAFTSPTSQAHLLPAAGSSPGQPYAVSQNELWLYRPINQSWTKVSTDGASPRFSTAGDDLFFLTGNRLMDFSLRTGRVVPTGMALPNTSVALLTGSPLATGGLFSPTATSTTARGWAHIDLSALDATILAPDDRNAVITFDNQPAVSILVRQDGSRLPILRNCGESAHYLTWAQGSAVLAFPLRGSESTAIYILSAATGATHLLVTFGGRPLINGISFSPDSKYLALSVGDGREVSPEIWIIPTRGSEGQVVAQGIAPRWSPTGTSLLYAGAGSATPFQWFLLPLHPLR
jgi:WD40 repeat protein